MKHYLISITLFFSFSMFGQYELIVAQKIDSENVDADEIIGVDNQLCHYYIQNSVLFKKSKTTIYQYQNISLGKIATVDILNPLRIVVFYENFNSAIVLDNHLNEIQKIDFSKSSTPILATKIGTSGQNKLWVLDQLSQQLGLYNPSKNSFQSLGVPLLQKGFSQSDFNHFYWIDQNNDWFLSTIFGEIKKNAALDRFDEIQIIDPNKILFSKDKLLFLLDKKKAKTYKIEIVENSFQKFYLNGQILSIFTNKEIINYKFILP